MKISDSKRQEVVKQMKVNESKYNRVILSRKIKQNANLVP